MGGPRKSSKPLSQYGDVLRPIRIRKKITLGSLSDMVGLSVPTLSLMETGGQPVSEENANRIVDALRLEGDDREALIRAADESRSSIVIEAQELLGRRLAAELKRKINRMNYEDLSTVLEIIARAKRMLVV